MVTQVEDQWHGVLLDPAFVERITSFYLETSRWLHWLDETESAGSSSGGVRVLCKLPEFVFKDIARWFSWPVQYQYINVSTSIGCIVNIPERNEPRCMRSLSALRVPSVCGVACVF